MSEKLKQLYDYIKSTPFETINRYHVEELTGSIIADDDYETLPYEIQNSVELLDSPDINRYNSIDIKECMSLIEVYLQR